jgi:predicted DNA-binding transcriptional regulator AlpA
MDITTIHVPQQLPESGYLRLNQIIGRTADPKSKPPKPAIPALIPVSKSTWWYGCASGRYPKPYQISVKCTAWKVEDIRALIARLASAREAR